jgi:hypothetical protein
MIAVRGRVDANDLVLIIAHYGVMAASLQSPMLGRTKAQFLEPEIAGVTKTKHN